MAEAAKLEKFPPIVVPICKGIIVACKVYQMAQNCDGTNFDE